MGVDYSMVGVGVEVPGTHPDPVVGHLEPPGVQFRVDLIFVRVGGVDSALTKSNIGLTLPGGTKVDSLLPSLKALVCSFSSRRSYSMKVSWMLWLAREFRGAKYDLLSLPCLLGET